MALLVALETSVIIFVMAWSSLCAPFAEVSHAYVDRQNVTIGDTFNLYIEICLDGEAQIDFSEVTQILDEFTIRDIKTLREEMGSGKIKQINKLKISLFDVGDHTIPSLPLLVRHDGNVDTLWTDQIPIKVESIVPDEAKEIRDIKPPLKPPRRWKQILLSYMILAGLIAGSAASVIASMKRRDVIIARLRALVHRIIDPIMRLISKLLAMLGLAGRIDGLDLDIVVNEPGLPPDVVAMKELDRIEALSLIDRGMIKEYYTLVSEVVRRYLERRFGVPVMESTTTDTLDMLTRVDLGGEPYRLIEDLLRESDLVKFAKFVPARDLAFEAISKARQIVELTREKIESQMVGEK